MDKKTIRIAIALIVGAMAPLFDSTIISVALHGLARELHSTVEVVQWVSTAYLLAIGVTIPLVGWLQARIGGKRLWIAGLAVFFVGSVLCSSAWDAPSLIAFRALQGVGGGVMMPLLTTLLVQAAGGRGDNFGRIMSVAALPASLGPILGPVVGGVILGLGDWRWLFWVNIPFAVVGLMLAWLMIPSDTRSTRVRLDVVGLVLLSPSIVAILYGLTNVGSDGGFGRFDVWFPVATGLILLAGFIVWALRQRGAALLDVRLLKNKPLAISTSLMFLTGVSLFGAMLLFPLYFQLVRGADALTAGLLLIPQGVGSLVSRSLAGRVNDRFGPRVVAVAGFGIITLTTIPFAFATGSTSEIWLLVCLFLRGLGLGAAAIPLMAVSFIGLSTEQMPHASIITRLSQQIGGSFGTAVLAVILQAGIVSAGLVAAFEIAFCWAVGFSALAVVLSLILPGRPRTVVLPVEERVEEVTV